MKKNLYVIIAVCAVILFSFQSCKKSADTPATSQKFELKGADGKAIQQLPPSLIKAIHSDLINKNRAEDAAQLYASYDTISGYLKSLQKLDLPYKNILENVTIDSTKMPYSNSNSLKLKSGWQDTYIKGFASIEGYPFYMEGSQANYDGSGNSSVPDIIVGTTGQNRRLYRMKITADMAINPATLPDLHYSVNAWNDGASRGWSPMATWGQWTGTDGSTACNMRMWFGSKLPNFTIWYCAHNEKWGWSGWAKNNEIAGRDGWRMEAFAFCILQY